MNEKKIDVEIVRITCSNEICGEVSLHSVNELSELGTIKCKKCGNSQIVTTSKS